MEKQLTSRDSSTYSCQLERVTTFEDLFFPYIVLKKELVAQLCFGVDTHDNKYLVITGVL